MQIADPKSTYNKEYQVMRFLYLALLVSAGVISGLTALLSQAEFPRWEPSAFENLIRLFFGGGAILIVVIFLLRRRLLPPPAAFLKPEANTASLLLKNRIGYLIIWSLSELVGLLGFMLLMLSGSLRYAMQFCGISLLLLVIFYPRRVAIK